MKIKLAQETHCRMYLIKLVGSLHPSRKMIFKHTFDADGAIIPSQYIRAVDRGLNNLVKLVEQYSDLQFHLLSMPSDEVYTQYLVVLTAVCDNNEFLELSLVKSKLGQKMISINPAEIAGSIRYQGSMISIENNAFSQMKYRDFGFELSILEQSYIMRSLTTTTDDVVIPKITGHTDLSITIGIDPLNRPVTIPPPEHTVIMGQVTGLLNFVNTGIIITNNPEKYRDKVEHTHKIGYNDCDIGLNLLQFYGINPSLLIEIIETIGTLTKNYHLVRVFFNVIDELYSNTEPENFFGISIKNFFIEDEYDAYQSMSDQQSKYQLHQVFTQYLEHEFFSTTNLEPLHKPGIHLLDVSETTENHQIMIDVVFRTLQNHGYLKGHHISDIFATAVASSKFNRQKQVHMQTISAPSIVLLDQFSIEPYKSSDCHLILTDADRIPAIEEYESKLMNTTHLKGLEGVLVTTPYYPTTIIAEVLTNNETINCDLIDAINFSYEESNAELEPTTIDEIEDEPSIFMDQYLSHYHIVSIMGVMQEYKTYQVDEIELSLLTDQKLKPILKELVQRDYVNKQSEGYEADAKGRSYFHRIRKLVDAHESEDEYDNVINYINVKLTESLSIQDASGRVESLLDASEAFEYLSNQMEFDGLMFHYYGLVASVIYLRDTEDSDEQFDEYVRLVNRIIDAKVQEEDLFYEVINRLKVHEEDENEIELDTIIDEIIASEEIQDIINETISEDIYEEINEFEPPSYDEIGEWYPSNQFNDILMEEVDNGDVLSILGIFTHFLLVYTEINTVFELDIYLEKFNLESFEITELEEHGIITRNRDRIISVAPIEYPMVPSYGKPIERDQILSYINSKLPSLTTEIKSQKVKKELISIFDRYQMQEYSFAIHALMSGNSKELLDILVEGLSTIQDKIKKNSENTNNQDKNNIPPPNPGGIPKPIVGKPSRNTSTSYLSTGSSPSVNDFNDIPQHHNDLIVLASSKDIKPAKKMLELLDQSIDLYKLVLILYDDSERVLDKVELRDIDREVIEYSLQRRLLKQNNSGYELTDQATDKLGQIVASMQEQTEKMADTMIIDQIQELETILVAHNNNYSLLSHTYLKKLKLQGLLEYQKDRLNPLAISIYNLYDNVGEFGFDDAEYFYKAISTKYEKYSRQFTSVPNGQKLIEVNSEVVEDLDKDVQEIINKHLSLHDEEKYDLSPEEVGLPKHPDDVDLPQPPKSSKEEAKST